jgi:hypothetical protein
MKKLLILATLLSACSSPLEPDNSCERMAVTMDVLAGYNSPCLKNAADEWDVLNLMVCEGDEVAACWGLRADLVDAAYCLEDYELIALTVRALDALDDVEANAGDKCH